jgi:hypothetical protein
LAQESSTFSAQAVVMEDIAMPELEKTLVHIDPNVIGSRIMLSNSVRRVLNQAGEDEFILRSNKRVFVLKKTPMLMPDVVLNFLRSDKRYAHFILGEVEVDEAPQDDEIPAESELVDTSDVIIVTHDDDTTDAIEDEFDDDGPWQISWEREDIEKANLNGDVGLKAFAEYHQIQLEGKLLSEVRSEILEWYDAQLR